MQSHQSIAAPKIGKTYTCVFNEMPLYDAVINNAQGCWATVTVVRPHPGKFEKQYSSGQTFDIKVQFYRFLEIP